MFSPSSVKRVPKGRIPRSLRLRDECGGAVAVEAKHPDRLCFQGPRRLLGDRHEDLDRRELARRKRRHSPQRRLLLGERHHLLSSVRVRDCSREQRAEVGETPLGRSHERAG